MIEVLKQALEALYPISHNSTDDYRGQADKAITSLRQAIAEAEKQSHPMMNMPHDRMVAMAYGHPPQRKPLTDEQVEKIIKANMSFQMNLAGIRQDFEAAYGIKE